MDFTPEEQQAIAQIMKMVDAEMEQAQGQIEDIADQASSGIPSLLNQPRQGIPQSLNANQAPVVGVNDMFHSPGEAERLKAEKTPYFIPPDQEQWWANYLDTGTAGAIHQALGPAKQDVMERRKAARLKDYDMGSNQLPANDRPIDYAPEKIEYPKESTNMFGIERIPRANEYTNSRGLVNKPADERIVDYAKEHGIPYHHAEAIINSRLKSRGHVSGK